MIIAVIYFILFYLENLELILNIRITKYIRKKKYTIIPLLIKSSHTSPWAYGRFKFNEKTKTVT